MVLNRHLGAGLAASPPPDDPDASPQTIPVSVQQAVSDAIARGQTHYTDRPGILPLRQKIADQISARFRVPVNAATDVVVTCGVTEARFVAIQQLLAPGDRLAAPTAPERIAGAVLLRRAQLTTRLPARVLYLTSSTPPQTLRAHLADAAEGTTLLFEVDDPTSTFHPAQISGLAPHTVTLGALGHPGWRIGYLLAPASASPAMREFKQALTICSTSLSQWAILAGLTEQPQQP